MDRYFQNNKIENYIDLKTLYFGGGTPSLISEENLEKLFKVINKFYKINNN